MGCTMSGYVKTFPPQSYENNSVHRVEPAGPGEFQKVGKTLKQSEIDWLTQRTHYTSEEVQILHQGETIKKLRGFRTFYVRVREGFS